MHSYPPPSSPTEVCVVDCGPHGSCISGVCQCEEGWTGPECEQRDCHPRCIDHGVCRDGKCDCHQGWTGEHCTIGETHTLAETHTHTPAHTLDTRLQTGEGNMMMGRLEKRASLECDSASVLPEMSELLQLCGGELPCISFTLMFNATGAACVNSWDSFTFRCLIK